MDRILECVPNISEGKDEDIILALANSIQSVNGVKLLHQDSGKAANRTVFTFAGEPKAVIEAAFNLYAKGLELIDMSQHSGTHPRQGAVDVCPLIPIKGLSINETTQLSYELGNRIGKELGIPGYYYEHSAKSPLNSNLADLRRGEYESLPAKFENLKVDFGETNSSSWKKSGATVIGARYQLIAYNVNLDTKDVTIAKRIAETIRESGKKGDKQKGLLKSVKAIGWHIKDFNKVQVSCNLTNIQKNGILEVFLAIKQLAQKNNTQVTGSELIGLLPKNELERVNQHLKVTDLNYTSAINFLGLNEIKPFEPQKRVIEYLL